MAGHGGEPRPLGQSASSPSLGSAGRSPLKLKARMTPTRKVRGRKPTHTLAWDDRHHLGGEENELKPKQLRAYFSKPQTEDALKLHLMRSPNSQTILSKLESEEVPYSKPTPLSADAGPPVCPSRHVNGGDMDDRDGEPIPWNNRWHAGIHIANEQFHPMHRAGFATKSLFENAPSQRWRRLEDVEVETGAWRPIQTKRPNRFPPLGV
eukprot:TRINITY_DN1546_c0_g1_i1.p1 TRINITY_DN1546_c0_g1~~TRINITY_DN1546_c0_g1_i1.p1  ORF type:complete len:208 (-),score=36.15 TRINITY_DN1546_c0_g1_i1:462-1085(-)